MAQLNLAAAAKARGNKMIAAYYLIVLLICIAITLLIRSLAPDDVRGVPSSTWEVFYGVFGVIYAIIIGFILAELLTRFHRLISDISNELNALQCIRDFMIYIDENEAAKQNIKLAVRIYLQSILDVEWDNMKSNTETVDSDTSKELYNLMNAVEQIRVIDESDRLALGQLIGHIADVTVYRTQRFDLASRHLSPVLHMLIVFMSIIMVAGLILISVPSLLVHLFMVLSMVTAVYLLYVVIIDLNMPFVGVWNINPQPFQDMLDRFDVET